MNGLEMLERRFTALEVRLDRHEAKTDRLLENMVESNKLTARNTASLEHHVFRTDTLQDLVTMLKEEFEREVEALEAQQDKCDDRIQALETKAATQITAESLKQWAFIGFKIIGILGMLAGLIMAATGNGTDVLKFFRMVVGL
jgi:hypothetical protein